MDIRDILITDIILSCTISRTTNERTNMNDRRNYGLTFAKSGEIVYTMDNKEYRSDKDHLLFLPKGQTYSLHCTEGGEFHVINFEIANTQSYSQIKLFQAHEPLTMQQIFLNLEVHSKSGHLRNRFRRLSLLYQLLSLAFISEDQKRMSPKRLILQPAMDYLENNYDDPELSNDILSKKSCVSEVYFRKLFKEEYGISPKQYVQKIRINKAIELLQSENISVTAVGEMVGYSSVFNFSKAFKMQTGYAPSEYVQSRGRL